MKAGRTAWTVLAGLAALAGRAALAGLIALAPAGAQAQPLRLSFQIATGSTAGTYFPMGELVAGIVSHPPGLVRCEARAVCGPPGLVLSARTSEGAVANLIAVNAGNIDSGFAQNNVVADALSGRGAFRVPLRHIMVIAALFPEPVQLVVARSSHIAKPGDLRGKRVSLGTEGSGGGVVARTVLAAYGVKLRGLKISSASYDLSASLLEQGKIDAFFFQGGVPSPLVGDLLARGTARLVAIDGRARRRLLARVPSFTADTIPAGVYAHTGATATISSRALWVVKDSASPGIVYGIVAALYNPANRALLDAGPHPAQHIRLDEATSGLTAPLHPGAERFYRAMGVDLKPHR